MLYSPLLIVNKIVCSIDNYRAFIDGLTFPVLLSSRKFIKALTGMATIPFGE